MHSIKCTQKCLQKCSHNNSSVDPIENFYLYVNGPWEETATIPDDQTEWGTFQIVHEENINRIKLIINQLATDLSNVNHPVGVLFERLLNIGKNDEQLIISRMKEYSEMFDAIDDLTDIGRVLGFLTKIHIEPFFSISASDDPKDSKNVRLTMSYPKLSLPEKPYYFDETLSSYVTEFSHNIKEFLRYCMFINLFHFQDDKEIELAAEKIVEIEKLMAGVMKPLAERRNIDKIYSKTSLKDLIDNLSNIMSNSKQSHGDPLTIRNMWDIYFKGADLSDAEYIIVLDISFMRKITILLTMMPLNDLVLYMKYVTLRGIGITLLTKFDELHFDFFERKVQGRKKILNRSERVINMLSVLVGEILSKEYVNKYFDLESKNAVELIVDNIKKQLGISLTKSQWMSEKTKYDALLKLKALRTKIGYPDSWRDHTRLVNMIKIGSSSNNLLDAIIAIKMYNYDTDIVDLIDRAPDDRIWGMNTYEVNAYFDSQRNEIVFPAGVLQKPFFDKNSSIFENYGAIGSIIGHEVTHGYDDQGRKYDYEGNIRNWWCDEDLRNFQEISKRMSEQYSSYVVNGKKVNGELTLGENLADLGGIVLAYRAAIKASIECCKGYIITNEDLQCFFISYTNLWKKVTRPEKTLMHVISDPHSPNILRVFILRNIDEFYQAFSSSVNYQKHKNSMYLEKSKRISLW